MIIKDKARLYWTAVWNGMHFDLVSILRDGTQRSLLTIDLHPSHLGMRHTKRLRQMLNRLAPMKIERNDLILLISSQKVVQSTEEQKTSCAHGGIIFCVSMGLPGMLSFSKITVNCITVRTSQRYNNHGAL